jgi:hypothetical protein
MILPSLPVTRVRIIFFIAAPFLIIFNELLNAQTMPIYLGISGDNPAAFFD